MSQANIDLVISFGDIDQNILNEFKTRNKYIKWGIERLKLCFIYDLRSKEVEIPNHEMSTKLNGIHWKLIASNSYVRMNQARIPQEKLI